MRASLLMPFVAVSAFALTARGDDRARFALDLSGVRCGLVRAHMEGDDTLRLGVQEIAPSLGSVVDTFAQGKAVKRDVRLTSGAVVKRAEGARLVSVKLPSIGSGGAPDVELAFAAPKVTTSPLLSAKEAPPAPSSERITSFHVELTGMQAIDAPKLDAITLKQKPDGSATTGDVTFEVAAGGAPPFVAWRKAAAKSPPKTLRLEYLGAQSTAILKLALDRCTPSSVEPLGASGTTRITLACGAVRGGS